MDFVVVGLGVGALAILLGLTSREAGPRWWPLCRDQPLSPSERARRLAIGRAGRAGGLVLCLAGSAIVVVTIIGLGLSLSDQAGAILVMATISATVLGGVAWATLYVARYHPRPLPRAPGRRPARESEPDEAPPTLAGPIDASLSRPGATGWADRLDIARAESEADSETSEPAALATDPAAAPPADNEGLPAEDEIETAGDVGVATAEPDEAAASEAPAAEPAVNGDGRPRPSGYAISSKNQIV